MNYYELKDVISKIIVFRFTDIGRAYNTLMFDFESNGAIT